MRQLKLFIYSASMGLARWFSGWWRKFKIDPYWRAFVEVASTVIFTFLPILLFSVPIIEGKGNITYQGVATNFLSYWKSGELALPVLGLCGTLFALVVLNRKLVSGLLAVVAILFAAIVATGGGYLLGTNTGFKDHILPEIVIACFLVYSGAVAIWFALAVTIEKGPRGSLTSDQRAQKLLDEANARKAVEGRR